MVRILAAQSKLAVVERLDDAVFRDDYWEPRRPVVLTRQTANWPALHKWTLDYFRERWGETTQEFSPLIGGLSRPPWTTEPGRLSDFLTTVTENQRLAEAFVVEKQQQVTTTETTSSAVAEHQATTTSSTDDKSMTLATSDITKVNGERAILYLQQRPVAYFPGIEEDYEIPSLLRSIPGTAFGSNTIFIGSMGIRTSLHYDRPLVDNLFTQIRGEKRFRMFQPQEGRYLYPYGFDTRHPHVSKIPELDAPVDLAQFPLFPEARIEYDFILEPGDMLFIPRGWWHHVLHNGPISISMNLWYY